MSNSHLLARVHRAVLLLAALTLLGATTAQLSVAQTPVARIDSELQAELDRIARETATLRALPPLATIDDRVLTRAEILAMIPELVAEELDPVETAALSRALAALGLIPESTDLYDLMVRLLGEQVAGYYDPRTDEMVVVADGEFGAAEYYYAHEVVHALQDAYLDPNDLMEDLTALNSDEELAVISLYEGDAVVASGRYLDAHPELAIALLR